MSALVLYEPTLPADSITTLPQLNTAQQSYQNLKDAFEARSLDSYLSSLGTHDLRALRGALEQVDVHDKDTYDAILLAIEAELRRREQEELDFAGVARRLIDEYFQEEQIKKDTRQLSRDPKMDLFAAMLTGQKSACENMLPGVTETMPSPGARDNVLITEIEYRMQALDFGIRAGQKVIEAGGTVAEALLEREHITLEYMSRRSALPLNDTVHSADLALFKDPRECGLSISRGS